MEGIKWSIYHKTLLIDWIVFNIKETDLGGGHVQRVHKLSLWMLVASALIEFHLHRLTCRVYIISILVTRSALKGELKIFFPGISGINACAFDECPKILQSTKECFWFMSKPLRIKSREAVSEIRRSPFEKMDGDGLQFKTQYQLINEMAPDMCFPNKYLLSI